jgi:phosphoribosylamine--glycine ligase
VVLAAGGYPDNYARGKVISGLGTSVPEGCKVFHAGTQLKDRQVLSNGGRVLCATALGTTVAEAQAKAYQVVDQISWDGMYCRRDIGWRAVAREQGKGKQDLSTGNAGTDRQAP